MVVGKQDSIGIIEELRQRIEDWMCLHAPERWQKLAPGVTEEAIKDMEGMLDIALPEDVHASYLRHNGGYEVELVSPMDILPLDSIIYNWKILRELLEDEDWAATPPYYFTDEIVLHSGWEIGPIQPVWWHARWIPFGGDSAGNHACLDLAPAPGGIVGQILDWDHECGPSRVLFPSFQQLLKAFAEQVESSVDEQAL